MRRAWRRLGVVMAAALLGAGLFSGGSARAWESPTNSAECNGSTMTILWPHKWKKLPVGYHILMSSKPAGLSEDQMVLIAANAFSKWQNAGQVTLSSEYLGATNDARLGDDKNDILFINSGFMAKLGKDEKKTLGLNVTFSDQTPATKDQGFCPPNRRCPDRTKPCAATESDTYLNATPETDPIGVLGGGTRRLDWARIAAEDTREFAVFTHEIGHFLGLGHSNTPVPQPLMHEAPKEPSMAPGATAVLRPDDIDGIRALYPEDQLLCENDVDCAMGDYCGGGCGPSINDDICGDRTPCPRAERCVEGMCEITTGQLGSPCAPNGKPGCDDGLTCELDENSSTRGRCSGPCTSDEQCAPNGRCRAESSGGDKTCVFPGNLEDGAACSADGECQSAACVKNLCANSCETDCECAYGLACQGGACLSGRSTCYYRDGRTDNRKLTATLCAVGSGARRGTDPAAALTAFGLALAWLSLRGASARRRTRRR